MVTYAYARLLMYVSYSNISTRDTKIYLNMHWSKVRIENKTEIIDSIWWIDELLT